MSLPVLSLGGGLLLLPILFGTPTGYADALPKPPRYVGVKSCKNCHKGEDKGDVYAKWEDGPHAKAYEVLATPRAKEVAAELKIADPQKSAKCLGCHVTAYDVDKKLKKRTLKTADGVGCESCHGPGENHTSARMKAAGGSGPETPVSPDEIITKRDISTCAGCHNEKSPTFKPFCFKERMKKIQHLDPRKNRTPEEIKAMEEKCTEGCEICSKKDKGAKGG